MNFAEAHKNIEFEMKYVYEAHLVLRKDGDKYTAIKDRGSLTKGCLITVEDACNYAYATFNNPKIAIFDVWNRLLAHNFEIEGAVF